MYSVPVTAHFGHWGCDSALDCKSVLAGICLSLSFIEAPLSRGKHHAAYGPRKIGLRSRRPVSPPVVWERRRVPTTPDHTAARNRYFDWNMFRLIERTGSGEPFY